MPQGAVLILYEDLENPGQWEDDNFAFDFKNFADILAGETLTGTPVVTSTTPSSPAGLTALTIGSRLAPTISGTLVQFSVTLPNGSVAGGLYPISCTVSTSGGKKLVQPGTLLAQGTS